MISIRNLRIDTATASLVDLEALDIAEKARVGLVGESGSGKTLTAMSIVGLQPRELTVSGSIRLDDMELVGASERRMSQIRGLEIGVVFQDPDKALDPVMRVGRQVAQAVRHGPRRSRTDVGRRVLELLDEVDLPDPESLGRRYPHELSGGQKQRVMIAIAIAQAPRLLIADEATTALDVTVQQRILELVLRICSEHNMGLLWISHDLGVVKAVCDRVAVMYDGHIVEEGPTEAITRSPRDAYTRRLLEANLDRAFATETRDDVLQEALRPNVAHTLSADTPLRSGSPNVEPR